MHAALRNDGSNQQGRQGNDFLWPIRSSCPIERRPRACFRQEVGILGKVNHRQRCDVGRLGMIDELDLVDNLKAERIGFRSILLHVGKARTAKGGKQSARQMRMALSAHHFENELTGDEIEAAESRPGSAWRLVSFNNAPPISRLNNTARAEGAEKEKWWLDHLLKLTGSTGFVERFKRTADQRPEGK